MQLDSEGGKVSPPRPPGPAGSPPPVARPQLRPPSVLRYRPLPEGAFGPSPPERKVQPLRRKSHIPTNRSSGLRGSMVTLEQPVERLLPRRTRLQVRPPSAVL